MDLRAGYQRTLILFAIEITISQRTLRHVEGCSLCGFMDASGDVADIENYSYHLFQLQFIVMYRAVIVYRSDLPNAIQVSPEANTLINSEYGTARSAIVTVKK